MATPKVRISLNLDEETYQKLLLLQKHYSEELGFKLDITKTIIKTLNDRNNWNMSNEEIKEY